MELVNYSTIEEEFAALKKEHAKLIRTQAHMAARGGVGSTGATGGGGGVSVSGEGTSLHTMVDPDHTALQLELEEAKEEVITLIFTSDDKTLITQPLYT